MDTDTINNHLKKLEELVLDEDKIVTVSSLCTTFNVTANESKLLLDEFISNNRKTQPESLAITYILSGLQGNHKPAISIVKENDLNERKDLYIEEPIVAIYSVQKCKEIDFNTVGLIDRFDANNPRGSPIKGSIVSKNCIKRQFKAKPVPISVVNDKPPLQSKSVTKPQLVNGIKASPKAVTVKPGSARKGTSVAALFKNAEPKSKVENTSVKTVNTDTTSNKNEKNPVTNNLQHLVDSDNEEDDVIQSTPQTIEDQIPKKRKSTKKSGKSKARKRIMVEQESDEDIFANDEDDEEEISRKRKNVFEDSEEDEPAPKPEPVQIAKNKKRKFVDKTFEDEDGYIITRKEWVELSGSDDEEKVVEVPVAKKMESRKVEMKKDVDKPDVNKNEKTVNGKAPKGKKVVPINQPTLMNFFKKK